MVHRLSSHSRCLRLVRYLTCRWIAARNVEYRDTCFSRTPGGCDGGLGFDGMQIQLWDQYLEEYEPKNFKDGNAYVPRVMDRHGRTPIADPRPDSATRTRAQDKRSARETRLWLKGLSQKLRDPALEINRSCPEHITAMELLPNSLRDFIHEASSADFSIRQVSQDSEGKLSGCCSPSAKYTP